MAQGSTTCAAASVAIDEPLPGTAPRAAAWLLVEQPGAWGAKALTESALDAALGAELERRAKAVGAKVLLVKCHRRTADATRRRAFVCSPAPPAPASTFLEEIDFTDPVELLDVDLETVAGGERTGLGRLRAEPLYLVCTNGRRDACCARLGVPVLRALEALRPGAAWECSHIGGHRFAANLVCLPDGICYGRVTPEAAPDLVRRHEAGELGLEHLRGRASLTPPEQAAESFLRLQEGIIATDALSVLATSNGATTFDVRDGRRFQVAVAVTEGPARPASCDEAPEPSERFELRSVRQLRPF
jgi:hypothetical protein